MKEEGHGRVGMREEGEGRSKGKEGRDKGKVKYTRLDGEDMLKGRLY